MSGKQIFLAVMFAAVATRAAAAEAVPPSVGACPLKELASIPLLIRPQADAIFVQASLNTIPKIMMVDTDAEASMISIPVVEELRLEPQVARAADPFYARPPNRVLFVNVTNFVLGNLASQAMQFRIAEGYVTIDAPGTVRPSFARYDIEFDFAAARMNLFQTSSCIEGPYWNNSGGAAIDIQESRSGLFRFPMSLDGKRVSAALDTARESTALRRQAAQTLFGVDSEQGSVTLHTLATETGGITINNPHLVVVAGREADEHYEPPDVFLGMATLKHLHLYVAYGRRKLFITAASGPPAVTMRLPVGQGDTAAEPHEKAK